MKLITDILEDQHTDAMKCYMCKHYLSVKPILTNVSNGHSICGRCQILDNTFIRNSSFEILAKQFSFPCMYAEAGCTFRRLFEDVKTHEAYCSCRTVNCFCSWSGTPLQLISHYTKWHNELIIKDGDNTIVNDNNTAFLFINKMFHFIVRYNCSPDDCSLEISGLTSFDTESNAVFICKLLDFHLDLRVEVNKILHSPHIVMPLVFSIDSEIRKELVDSVSKSIMCQKCSMQMTPPILRCSKGHVTCIECIGYSISYCEVCECYSHFICCLELDYIAAVSMFACKWKCRKEFNANKIREHEQACNERVYECGQHDWKGRFAEFEEHINSNDHYATFVSNTNEFVYLGGGKYMQLDVMIHNCRFDIYIRPLSEKISVFVSCNDLYAIGWFDFVLELIHIEDQNFVFNKTYEVKHNLASSIGDYKADIPETDTLQFGIDKPFKVILRVIYLTGEERRAKLDSVYNHFKSYRRLLC